MLAVTAMVALGSNNSTNELAAQAFDRLVLRPTRDVSIHIDDLSGDSPMVARVDDEASTVLSVDNDDTEPRDSVALLAFTTPTVPDGAVFRSARLRMVGGGSLQPDQPTRTLWAAGNGAAWDPATMTGRAVPPMCCSFAPWAEPRRDNRGWIEWDVSGTVAYWIAGGPNFGLRVLPSQHIISDHYYYGFSSMEGEQPPELVVEFQSATHTIWLPFVSTR